MAAGNQNRGTGGAPIPPRRRYLRFPFDYLFTLDNTNHWRRNLVWAKMDGGELRNILTQRFASNSVFLTLIGSSLLSILFSPSTPAVKVREALKNIDHSDINFWAGVSLAFSILSTLLGLYANFTAWGILSAVSNKNVHAITRSSLGLFAAALPSRLIVMSIFLFFITILLFLFVICDSYLAMGMSIASSMVLILITTTYSALGRIIAESGAMGYDEVLTKNEEEDMNPDALLWELEHRVRLAHEADIALRLKYRTNFQESLRQMDTYNRGVRVVEDEMIHVSTGSNRRREEAGGGGGGGGADPEDAGGGGGVGRSRQPPPRPGRSLRQQFSSTNAIWSFRRGGMRAESPSLGASTLTS